MEKELSDPFGLIFKVYEFRKLNHLAVRLFFLLTQIKREKNLSSGMYLHSNYVEKRVGCRKRNLVLATNELVKVGLLFYQSGSTRNPAFYMINDSLDNNSLDVFKNLSKNQSEINSLNDMRKKLNKKIKDYDAC